MRARKDLHRQQGWFSIEVLACWDVLALYNSRSILFNSLYSLFVHWYILIII